MAFAVAVFPAPPFCDAKISSRFTLTLLTHNFLVSALCSFFES